MFWALTGRCQDHQRVIQREVETRPGLPGPVSNWDPWDAHEMECGRGTLGKFGGSWRAISSLQKGLISLGCKVAGEGVSQKPWHNMGRVFACWHLGTPPNGPQRQ